MALTWVVSEVLGNGTPPSPRMTDATGPYRPAVGVLGPFRAVSAPGYAWMLVLIDADPVALAAETRWDLIPGELTDVIRANTANGINQKLSVYGIPAVAVAGMTIRQVVEAVAHVLDPTFDVNWFPVT